MKIRRTNKSKQSAELDAHDETKPLKGAKARAKLLLRAHEVLTMVVHGFTNKMVADQLGCDTSEAARIITHAFREYTKDVELLIQDNNCQVLASDCALRRTWMPLAIGYTDPHTGERHPPDKFAAAVICKLNQERIAMNRMLKPQKIELTNQHQGDAPSQVDEREAARLMRAEFGTFAALPLALPQESGDGSAN